MLDDQGRTERAGRRNRGDHGVADGRESTHGRCGLPRQGTVEEDHRRQQRYERAEPRAGGQGVADGIRPVDEAEPAVVQSGRAGVSRPVMRRSSGSRPARNHPIERLGRPRAPTGDGRTPPVRFGGGRPERRTTSDRPNPDARAALDASPERPFVSRPPTLARCGKLLGRCTTQLERSRQESVAAWFRNGDMCARM